MRAIPALLAALFIGGMAAIAGDDDRNDAQEFSVLVLSLHDFVNNEFYRIERSGEIFVHRKGRFERVDPQSPNFGNAMAHSAVEAPSPPSPVESIPEKDDDEGYRDDRDATSSTGKRIQSTRVRTGSVIDPKAYEHCHFIRVRWKPGMATQANSAFAREGYRLIALHGDGVGFACYAEPYVVSIGLPDEGMLLKLANHEAIAKIWPGSFVDWEDAELGFSNPDEAPK